VSKRKKKEIRYLGSSTKRRHIRQATGSKKEPQEWLVKSDPESESYKKRESEAESQTRKREHERARRRRQKRVLISS
jgi:hypothetical protein